LKKTRRIELPRYIYRCDVCGDSFEISHSISEKLTDCECGEEGSLKRIPSLPFRASIKINKQKAGEVVKEFIEDTRKQIDQTKKEMSKEVDDV
jgi:putative FmdB family regulatory protein